MKKSIVPVDPVEHDIKVYQKYVGQYYRNDEDRLLYIR